MQQLLVSIRKFRRLKIIVIRDDWARHKCKTKRIHERSVFAVRQPDLDPTKSSTQNILFDRYRKTDKSTGISCGLLKQSVLVSSCFLASIEQDQSESLDNCAETCVQLQPLFEADPEKLDLVMRTLILPMEMSSAICQLLLWDNWKRTTIANNNSLRQWMSNSPFLN